MKEGDIVRVKPAILPYLLATQRKRIEGRVGRVGRVVHVFLIPGRGCRVFVSVMWRRKDGTGVIGTTPDVWDKSDLEVLEAS